MNGILVSRSVALSKDEMQSVSLKFLLAFNTSSSVQNQVEYHGTTYFDDERFSIHVLTRDGTGASGTVELGETDRIDINTDDSGSPAGRMWVDYSNQLLQIYLNNAGDTIPASAQLELDIDLTTLFSGHNKGLNDLELASFSIIAASDWTVAWFSS